MILAPMLSRQLVLEAPTRQPDGGGGYVESWHPLGTLWASVSARSGGERAEPGASVSATNYRIVVRGAPNGSTARPMPQQRFRDKDRVYVIQAVAEHDPHGRYLACSAEEEVVA